MFLRAGGTVAQTDAPIGTQLRYARVSCHCFLRRHGVGRGLRIRNALLVKPLTNLALPSLVCANGVASAPQPKNDHDHGHFLVAYQPLMYSCLHLAVLRRSAPWRRLRSWRPPRRSGQLPVHTGFARALHRQARHVVVSGWHWPCLAPAPDSLARRSTLRTFFQPAH